MKAVFLRSAAIAFTLCFVVCARADGPAYFREDGGEAANDGQPLPETFSDEQLVWKQELLPGNSTPCICGDRIFLTTWDAEKRELATVALDRERGRPLWKKPVPTTDIEPFHPVGSPASSTPACDGRQLYAFFGSYGLLCYDLEGNLLWSKRMGPFQDEFGASSSPVLADGKVFLNEDHDVGSFLIAIDQETGDTVWKVEREGFTRSYSTPVIWQADGTTQIIVAGALQLTAYDAADGTKLWWVNGLSRIVDTTPVQSNGLLYVATWTPGGDESERIAMEPFPKALEQYDADGDGKIGKAELFEGPVLERFFRIDLDQDGKLDEEEWKKHSRVFELARNAALAIEPGGRGDVTETHVKWTYDRGLPTVPSPIVYDGVLYMVKDSGIITSVDAQTGELLKQGRAAGRGNYYASLVAGDGKVYLVAERGELTVLKAGREWEVLTSHDFGERIMATPVLADGRIYIRTENALYCFGKSV